MYTDVEKGIVELIRKLKPYERIEITKDRAGLSDTYYIKIIPPEKRLTISSIVINTDE